MPKQRTYTETLEEILSRLNAPGLEALGTTVQLLAAHMDHVEANQQELLKLARETNGHVRTNSQAIAKLQQWQVDHEQADDTVRERIDQLVKVDESLCSRINQLIAINGTIAAIAGAISSAITTWFQK